jgi:hypothetical protein
MLSDPKFVAWLVGSLLVWFVAQFFVVGEIFDMLLAGAALSLSGAGMRRRARRARGSSSTPRAAARTRRVWTPPPTFLLRSS